MQIVMTGLFALLASACAAYAHYLIPAQTSPGPARWFTHGLLVVMGLALGWAVATVYYSVEGLLQVLVFIYAFGSVHIPAAGILFLKQRKSREQRQGAAASTSK